LTDNDPFCNLSTFLKEWQIYSVNLRLCWTIFSASKVEAGSGGEQPAEKQPAKLIQVKLTRFRTSSSFGCPEQDPARRRPLGLGEGFLALLLPVSGRTGNTQTQSSVR
jgi:hypothetical protein